MKGDLYKCAGIVAVCIAIVLVVFMVVNEANESAVMSMLLSVHDCLGTKSPVVPCNGGFRELHSREYEQCMHMALGCSVDGASRAGNRDGMLLDVWGRPLRLGVYRDADDTCKYVVWSSGRDGESGSADDIVMSNKSRRPVKRGELRGEVN